MRENVDKIMQGKTIINSNNSDMKELIVMKNDFRSHQK